METAIRKFVERRRVSDEFIARGLASRDEAQRTRDYVSVEQVMAKLRAKTDATRDRQAEHVKAVEATKTIAASNANDAQSRQR